MFTRRLSSEPLSSLPGLEYFRSQLINACARSPWRMPLRSGARSFGTGIKLHAVLFSDLADGSPWGRGSGPLRSRVFPARRQLIGDLVAGGANILARCLDGLWEAEIMIPAAASSFLVRKARPGWRMPRVRASIPEEQMPATGLPAACLLTCGYLCR